MNRTFTQDDARDFYNRFGSRQDLQAFYENPAISDLLAHADFEHARSVFELGFGTGTLALRLLSRHLPADCRYSGVDVSTTMMGLANERLKKWREYVAIKVSDGSKHIDAPDEAFDRFVSTYVLDLLSPESCQSVISEAHRVLRKGGKLCLVSLTEGRNMPGHMVAWVWKRVYSMSPKLVGGCRPIELLDYLSPGFWQIDYCRRVASFGITSEIVIATPKPSPG